MKAAIVVETAAGSITENIMNMKANMVVVDNCDVKYIELGQQ